MSMTIRALVFLLLVIILAACGGDDPVPTREAEIPPANYEPAVVEQGERNYGVFCTACHGPDATGIQGLGPSLLESNFFNSHTDEELLDFIIAGRPADHPDNTTGIAMPPRGGFPNMSDEQISSIIAFLRTEIAEG